VSEPRGTPKAIATEALLEHVSIPMVLGFSRATEHRSAEPGAPMTLQRERIIIGAALLFQALPSSWLNGPLGAAAGATAFSPLHKLCGEFLFCLRFTEDLRGALAILERGARRPAGADFKGQASPPARGSHRRPAARHGALG